LSTVNDKISELQLDAKIRKLTIKYLSEIEDIPSRKFSDEVIEIRKTYIQFKCLKCKKEVWIDEPADSDWDRFVGLKVDYNFFHLI